MKLANFGLVGIPILIVLGTTAVGSASAPGPNTCLGNPVTITAPSGHLENGTPIFRGTTGRDVISGTTGNDVIYGFKGNDIICGWGGDDSIFAGQGADTVFSGEGDDIVQGGWGADVLYGGPGNDVIRGSNGADTIYGEAGTDRLIGNPGHDTLIGGPDYDTTNGGLGTDNCEGENVLTCESGSTNTPAEPIPVRTRSSAGSASTAPNYDGTPESVLAITDHIFPTSQHENVRTIFACENPWLDPTIEGRQSSPEHGIDYGLFQINARAHTTAIPKALPELSTKSQQIYAAKGLIGALKDAHFNIEYAYYITQTETWRATIDHPTFDANPWRRTRWGAWTCGKDTTPWHF